MLEEHPGRPPGRPGPAGVGCGRTGRPGYIPTHSSPMLGLPGPLHWDIPLPEQLGGWVVLPRYIPPSTHPVYPSWDPYPHPYMAVTAVPEGADTRFWTLVGEPRGIGTLRFQGPGLVIYSYLRLRGFTRPFAVVLLSLGHCFTEFRTLLY